jgi:tyrosyl-tRNA synthetase
MIAHIGQTKELMMSKSLIDVLKERGFIDSTTSEDIDKICQNPVRVYCGFDPTCDSLHLGNFIPIMGLAWFQRYGHTPVVIVGGATGMIGDPSGKSTERQLLDEQTIDKNLAGIKKNLETILDTTQDNTKPIFLNNYEWFKKFSYLDFLRDVGKNFRMGVMLSKDSVKNRLNSEDGMSFTEFSYQTLQGYDFLHLFDNYKVTLQMGGSDQWGNILAGTELIKKVRGATVHGITFPLLTRSDGQKFGKSEKGAIWLSPDKLSPYEFYQYLYRVADADVIKLLKVLTFIDMKEIHEYEKMLKDPSSHPNVAQKRLAEEVTRIVHGEEGLQKALRATEAAAPGSNTILNAESLESIAGDMPSKELPLSEVVDNKVLDVLVKVGLQPSKGDARKLIRNGGVSINNEKVVDENAILTRDFLIDGRLVLLAVGKKNKLLIRIL